MAEEPAGAIQRPSFRCHAALPSRSSGSASAIRALRTGPGNCFFSTTHALTTTAMAMMADRENSARDVATQLGVSLSTLYAYGDRKGQPRPRAADLLKKRSVAAK